MLLRRITVAILLVCCILLNGCSSNPSIENQAYVLVMGVDTMPGDRIGLTILIPKIGASGGASQEDSGNKDASYVIVSAEGDSYQSALEGLKWSATRELNLSQIKMIVFSEEISKKNAFKDVITTIAETYHLYTASRMVICQGSANEFINGHETVLGTRLFNELDAMFDHYSELGYIPVSNFADVYYAMQSIYSDPMTIWGFPSEQGETGATQASAMIGSDSEMKALTKTPSSRHYLGAVVLKNGKYSDKLNAHQTLIANLLSGNLDSFNYEANGQTFQLTPLERPSVRISFSGDKTDIIIKMRLSAIAQNSTFESNTVAPVIERDILETIRYCQNRSLEPFGFANKAALKVATIDEWFEMDWHNKYQNADISVNVHVMRSDS